MDWIAIDANRSIEAIAASMDVEKIQDWLKIRGEEAAAKALADSTGKSPGSGKECWVHWLAETGG